MSDPLDVRGPVAEGRRVIRRHPSLRRIMAARFDPERATGLALTMAAAVAALGAVSVGALLEMVDENSGFARFDDSAARFGVDHLTDTTTMLFRFGTNLGATRYMAALAVVIGIIEHRRRPNRAVFGFLAVALIGTVVITNVVKVVVDRDRPDISRLMGAHGASFPSGHTSTAAAGFAALALVMGRGRSHRTKALLAAVGLAVTVMVAASRVLLGVHWLTDVTAGAALGWAWFALTSIMFGGRLLNFGEPVEQLQQTAQRQEV